MVTANVWSSAKTDNVYVVITFQTTQKLSAVQDEVTT